MEMKICLRKVYPFGGWEGLTGADYTRYQNCCFGHFFFSIIAKKQKIKEKNLLTSSLSETEKTVG